MPAIKGKPNLKRRTRVTLVCTICGKSYEQIASRANSSKYCSKECWGRRAAQHTCLCCGKAFDWKTSTGIDYCSRECAFKHKVGELASAWKDGKSLKRLRGSVSRKLTVWRKAINERDNYTCQRCGATGITHAHHLKSFSEFPELRFDISNGTTLCVNCHSLEHGRDLATRRNKICPDCGTITSGQGRDGLCRSCSTKRQWIERKYSQ